MSYWSKPPESRDQLVLFSRRLDEVIEADHPVRLLDEILGSLDWSEFEKWYDGTCGQPPIHPRVLASVTLYGVMTRIRSSRALEDALKVRLDFRWLAEGRSIDHTTLSEFRRQRSKPLKDLFVQIGMVAREMGLLPLEQLAYDGTRIRANNRRQGARTPDELKKWREELSRKYEELEQRLAQADAAEQDVSGADLPAELKDTGQRLKRIDAALAELKRVEEAEETVPKRIPMTDPQSRITPNKEGGFAANYTPLATVDTTHGFIVSSDVIAMTDEEHFLVGQIQQVQEDFGLNSPPAEMLADGMMATGANLQDLTEMGVTLYSPVKSMPADQNPAVRADLTKPVAEDQWDRLPTFAAPGSNGKQRQFSKEAFVYDAQNDCYWCPAGKRLDPQRETVRQLATGPQTRTDYKAEVSSCSGCPLRDRCLQKTSQSRQVSRYDHESKVDELAARMETPEAKKIYARRRYVMERPFAEIKQRYGARQFLLRGLEKVRTEWRWLTTAFNLDRLMSLWPPRAGPDPDLSSLQGCRG